MSARRVRAATGAERRAARRKARRATEKSPPWFWLGTGGLALLAVAIFVGVRLASSGGGSEPGEAASNVAPGAGAELSQVRTADFHSMAISPADPDVVLYGHHGGILQSTNGGRDWLTTNLSGATDDAMGMAFAGPGGDTVFAAGHGVFFKSIDGGRTWERMRPDLPSTDIHGLAAAPDDANRVYAYVVGFGLYRSADAGTTWAPAAADLPGDVHGLSAGPGGVVYASGMESGILRSDDGGMTFTSTGAAGAMTVAASGSDPDVVYTGGMDVLLQSTDGGASWRQHAVPGGGQVLIAAVNPTDPRDVTIVAVRDDRAGHAFRSKDGGATWGSG